MRTDSDRIVRGIPCIVRRGLALSIMLLFGLLAAAAGLVTTTSASAQPGPSPSSNTLQIVVPKPSNGAVSGPVGTNVSITGVGAQNQPYQLGYALKSDGCSDGFQQLQISPVTTKSDGTFSATFAWPGSGTSQGSGYYVCAQNTNSALTPAITPPLQSDAVFTVLTEDAPPNVEVEVAAPTGSPTRHRRPRRRQATTPAPWCSSRVRISCRAARTCKRTSRLARISRRATRRPISRSCSPMAPPPLARTRTASLASLPRCRSRRAARCSSTSFPPTPRAPSRPHSSRRRRSRC